MVDIRPGIKDARDSDLFRFLVALRNADDITDIEFRNEVVAEMKLRKPAEEMGSAGLQPITNKGQNTGSSVGS